MNRFILVAAGFCLPYSAAVAQNYQTQYPYDPYSGSPQPHQVQQPQSSGYQTYGSSSSYGGGDASYEGGGYGKNPYSNGYGGGGGGTSYSSLLGWGSLEGYIGYNDFRGDDRLDGDVGFGVDVKARLMKPLYLHFGLDRITSEDPSARKISVTALSAGLGAYLPIGQRFQIYGEVGFRYDFTSGDLDYINPDDFSLYMRPGIRFAATERLELTASVMFHTTENLNDRAVELTAYYSLLSWLDVSGGVDFGSDMNLYRVGARWRWD